MSLHRATFVAFAALFTIGATSVAFADCCQSGVPAPVVYSNGCGGCGAAPAPVIYVQPVAPPPPPVTVTTWGNGNGCGCNHSVVYVTPSIEPTPIAPAPIYVVNQGPEYSGPGVMVPYRTYAPAAAYAPEAYPYMPGYRPHPYYRTHVAYHEHMYAHPHHYVPAHWRSYPHRPLGVRD
jgi:hypothetical protein